MVSEMLPVGSLLRAILPNGEESVRKALTETHETAELQDDSHDQDVHDRGPIGNVKLRVAKIGLHEQEIDVRLLYKTVHEDCNQIDDGPHTASATREELEDTGADAERRTQIHTVDAKGPEAHHLDDQQHQFLFLRDLVV
eukprot:CAMPEP_0194510064 /NCGR_PEP_ID=MMETSP0253-20130528/41388_1 /TAXON_ID=2966 /ORGANISM="Noctiluca scintillans" /LENGTH=139 /DNA_ID=CAMNT_0039353283 /DNA_START=248 /DNA_END=667 /DNA_ORIENTATION=-